MVHYYILPSALHLSEPYWAIGPLNKRFITRENVICLMKAFTSISNHWVTHYMAGLGLQDSITQDGDR